MSLETGLPFESLADLDEGVLATYVQAIDDRNAEEARRG